MMDFLKVGPIVAEGQHSQQELTLQPHQASLDQSVGTVTNGGPDFDDKHTLP